MKSSQIVESLQAIKGQHVSVVSRRTRKVRKGSPDVVKRTIAYVRTGIDYANLTVVKDAIAAKERGEVQLIWNGKGEWAVFPFVIRHVVTGQEYMRLYPASFDDLKPSAQYSIDGAPVDFETVRPYLLASELPSGEIPLCYTLKSEDIETIGI